MGLLVIFAFLILLGVASAVGLSADSRDSADWISSRDGLRQPRQL